MFVAPNKEKLGNRFICYECGTKFYDLTRPEAICPDCDANQESAPMRDLKALLVGTKERKAAAAAAEPEPTKEEEVDEDEDENADDDLAGDFDNDEDESSGEEEED